MLLASTPLRYEARFRQRAVSRRYRQHEDASSYRCRNHHRHRVRGPGDFGPCAECAVHSAARLEPCSHNVLLAEGRLVAGFGPPPRGANDRMAHHGSEARSWRALTEDLYIGRYLPFDGSSEPVASRTLPGHAKRSAHQDARATARRRIAVLVQRRASVQGERYRGGVQWLRRTHRTPGERVLRAPDWSRAPPPPYRLS
jgi:hypothetical protein